MIVFVLFNAGHVNDYLCLLSLLKIKKRLIFDLLIIE